MKSHKYLIGIDEVGRGPIAGPVAVCALLLRGDFSRRDFKGLKDSKKLTQKKREMWFSKVNDSKSIVYAVSFVHQNIIDSKGIVCATRTALNRSLIRLHVKPKKCLVLLDGGLRAPKRFMYQKTIIRGDEKEYAIALASIMAKVTRDRKMVKLSKKYPLYGFNSHKGYGTKKHYEKIKKCGLCELHRRSFLKQL